MKKRLLVLVLALVLTPSIVLAGVASEQITVQRNVATVMVNGEKVNADSFAYNGTTYVPLRVVSENLGSKVDWNNTTKTAAITSSTPNISGGSVLGNDQRVVVLAYSELEKYYDYLHDAYTEVYYTISNQDTGDIYNLTVECLNDSKIPRSVYTKFTNSDIKSLAGLSKNHDYYIENLNTCLNIAKNGNLSKKDLNSCLDLVLTIGGDIFDDREFCRDELVNNLYK